MMNHRQRIEEVMAKLDALAEARPDLEFRARLVKTTLDIADVTPAEVTRVGAYADNMLASVGD